MVRTINPRELASPNYGLSLATNDWLPISNQSLSLGWVGKHQSTLEFFHWKSIQNLVNLHQNESRKHLILILVKPLENQNSAKLGNSTNTFIESPRLFFLFMNWTLEKHLIFNSRSDSTRIKSKTLSQEIQEQSLIGLLATIHALRPISVK